MSDLDRVRRLLGGEELAWLVDRARARLSRGRPLTGRVVLADPGSGQREAVARLLGVAPRSGTSLGVDLASVDDVLRRSGACSGLAEAVVMLGGEVTVRAEEEARVSAAWEEVWARLDGETRPTLVAWAEGLRTSGTVKRLAPTPSAAAQLLAEVAVVVEALPADAEPRGRLAARVLGHAHALDDGRPLTTLVLGAARALGGVGDGTGARWRREVWASVGVLRDDLSSTVLALGLPGHASPGLGRVLGEWRSLGEPVSLTLRQVRIPGLGEALGLASGQEVFLCENPVVLASAADRYGAASPPLVCVNGQPGVAVQVLLQGLVDAGARLRHHGDFDWGGLRIANALIARFGAEPWRMDTGSYLAAAASGLGRPLTGPPAVAKWDPALTPAMSVSGLGIDEEHVLSDLLGDLGP